MGKPAFIKIDDQYKGDTYDGVQFTILNTEDSSPVDLTGVVIKVQFRFGTKVGAIEKQIVTGDGITLSDPENGVFSINPFIIDWQAGSYYYDVEMTFQNGNVRTYIEGTIKVIQDVTNG